jgi:hypothetical protein
VSPFDFWLVIVGLAVGAGLAALVMVDLRRRDDDVSGREVRSEAAWIADTLRREEIAADAEAVEEVLRLHRAYLAGMPDERSWLPASPLEADAAEEEGAPAGTARPVSADPSPAVGEAALPEQAEPADDELVYRAPAEDR